MSRHPRKIDEFIQDAEARQRNIVFPDTVRNGRSVDAFFWRGSPNPTVVQRIAAWMFGLTFVVLGLMFLFLIPKIEHTSDFLLGIGAFLVLGLFCLLVGARIFRNGFPRKQ